MSAAVIAQFDGQHPLVHGRVGWKLQSIHRTDRFGWKRHRPLRRFLPLRNVP
jgi:hypothetical protein